ncbi:hypothetical protein [Xanthocytophaga flava]|uniref:hypothetical protein n=1 Tax=Xanthocytophaga flava TaxID=3048013 RepID=UPI0028D012E0|nr:hypothetical protein [Xanthocytophaga flavus]MDJ1473177.1 hypothetical protein [Xanthocytophaga flavus]
MSTTILHLIPFDPSHVPTNTKQQTTKALLNILFPSKEIELVITEETIFIDSGQYFTNVHCHLCGDVVKIEIWQDAMDAAYNTRFRDLTFTTPCCSRETSLNSLDYKMPSGFSRFMIIIRDLETELSIQNLQQIEKAMGCHLREIWTRY